MARGGNYTGIPNNIYYVVVDGECYFGPYTKKPTGVQKSKGDEVVNFIYNEQTLNYEKVLTLQEEREKKIGELVDDK